MSAKHCSPLDRSSYEALVEEYLPDSEVAGHLHLLIDDSRPAFLCRYEYGQSIVTRGQIRPPCDDSGCSCCSELAAQLEESGSTIPLCLVTSKSAEVFIDHQEVTGKDRHRSSSKPLRILSQGELFGVFEFLDDLFGLPESKAPWSVSAGVRSVVLPWPRGSRSAKRSIRSALRAQGFSVHREGTSRVQMLLGDDWEFCRFLLSGDGWPVSQGADSRDDRWETNVVVFPRAMEPGDLRTDDLLPALARIGRTGWMQSHYLRGQLLEEEELAESDHLKGNTIPYDERIPVIRVAREILAMARGELPAFIPVDRSDENRALPTRQLLALLERFPGVDYEPVVLRPTHLHHPGDTGYVSVKLNCWSILGDCSPRIFDKFSEHVIGILHSCHGGVLDMERTNLLARSTDTSLELLSLTGNAEPRSKLAARHPFLTGCIRIVRS